MGGDVPRCQRISSRGRELRDCRRTGRRGGVDPELAARACDWAEPSRSSIYGTRRGKGTSISTSKAKDPSTEIAERRDVLQGIPAPPMTGNTSGEGLGPFYWYGLSRPTDERYRVRLRRFAGLYMNEDRGSAELRPKLKIIPSLFNGSRGAKLSPNTQEDWNGRLIPGTKPSTRFLKATNILGDHPLNLGIDQSRVSRLPGHPRRQVPQLAARIRRRVESANRRPTAGTSRPTSGATGRSVANGAENGTAACSAGTRLTRASATTCFADRRKGSGMPCC